MLDAFYPQAKPRDTASNKAWMLALGDEDYPSCARAVVRLSKRSKFRPSLAEIVDEAAEIRRNRMQEADVAGVRALPERTAYGPEDDARAAEWRQRIRDRLAETVQRTPTLPRRHTPEQIRRYLEHRSGRAERGS